MTTLSITTKTLATWVVLTKRRSKWELVRLFLVRYLVSKPYLTVGSLLISGLVGAPACGDVMKLQFETDENGIIIDAKFKTFGCGSAIGKLIYFCTIHSFSNCVLCRSCSASSSVATEWLKGKTIEECMAIRNTDIATHLKLPPVKLHCSMLAEDAIKAAVKDYQSKNVEVTHTKAATA